MDAQRLRREAESPTVATKDDLPEVIATLTDAFAHDLDMDWFMRADGRRAAARQSLFARLIRGAAFPHGRIDRPASGAAAAVWMPFEWVRPDRLPEILIDAVRLLPITGVRRAHRLAALRRVMDRRHPLDRRHAYLWLLGVAPAAQGRGIGSALLRAAHARLDAEALPAYLETSTPRNVGLYERHGYRVISEGAPARGAPTMWSMWREPAR
jgi:GNAT superfamily N-acetyltransferase